MEALKCSKISWQLAALTLPLIKHSGPTPAPQTITDCGYLTLDFGHFGISFSPVFLQTLAPWFLNDMQPLSPGQVLLPLFLVQKWLDLGNAAPIAHFLHTPVHGGSGCFYSRLSPMLSQVPQGLESVLLHNLPQGPVISSRCAAFFCHTFSFPQTCLDTALWEQPICSEISFCVYPLAWGCQWWPCGQLLQSGRQSYRGLRVFKSLRNLLQVFRVN